MVSVRTCVYVVTAAVTVVARSVSDGRVPRSDRSRPTVEYYLHVNVTDVSASSLYLRTSISLSRSLNIYTNRFIVHTGCPNKQGLITTKS